MTSGESVRTTARGLDRQPDEIAMNLGAPLYTDRGGEEISFGRTVTFSDIVNGKRAITTDTALRLDKCLGVSPEVWLGLQAEPDLRVARRTSRPEIEPRVTRAAWRTHRQPGGGGGG
ncbi:MAG: HigA family addiction module antitoxin [Pseudomonadota bacterium]